ncbi:hypothetical protein C0585_05450 [Candidatus Woesearchaeota archaeon]|nr:MAG: hypothetical protein C0585_05450 [Candidatus Woesearchaeota archaeon]
MPEDSDVNPSPNWYCDSWSREGTTISGGCSSGEMMYQVYSPRTDQLIAYSCIDVSNHCVGGTVVNEIFQPAGLVGYSCIDK